MLLPEVSSSNGADCPVLQKLTRAMYRHVLCAMLHHQPPPGQTRVGILYEGRIMKQEYGTKRPNFPFSVCVLCMYIYMGTYVCGSAGIWVQNACGGPTLMSGDHLLLSYLFLMRQSQSNTEVADITWLVLLASLLEGSVCIF